MISKVILTTESELKSIVDEAVSKALKESTHTTTKELLTRPEAAKKLGISVAMVDKLVRSGQLVKHKIGRKSLIRSSSISELLKQRA